MRSALITGGAGFIGWNLAKYLLSLGWTVTIYDNLHPRVHGTTRAWPVEISQRLKELKDAAELEAGLDGIPAPIPLQVFCGDIRNGTDFLTCLAESKPHVVFHLAAQVGVGESAYRPAEYVSANTTGTVCVLDWLTHAKRLAEKAAGLLHLDPESLNADERAAIVDADNMGYRLETLFVAGSMSSYGEGTYRTKAAALLHLANGAGAQEFADGAVLDGNLLGTENIRNAEIHQFIESLPTYEEQPLAPASVYAKTKADTEQYALMIGEQNGLRVVVGRFFNVYGPGQAIGNGYTGVIATFAGVRSRGGVPLVYDDGNQSRDFIHVDDVVTAVHAIATRGEAFGVYNVSTGIPTTVLEVAQFIAQAMGDLEEVFTLTGTVRVGDIRHCIGASDKLRQLGWEPKVRVQEGIPALCTWLLEHPEQQVGVVAEQAAVVDELAAHGMTRPL